MEFKGYENILLQDILTDIQQNGKISEQTILQVEAQIKQMEEVIKDKPSYPNSQLDFKHMMDQVINCYDSKQNSQQQEMLKRFQTTYDKFFELQSKNSIDQEFKDNQDQKFSFKSTNLIQLFKKELLSICFNQKLKKQKLDLRNYVNFKIQLYQKNKAKIYLLEIMDDKSHPLKAMFQRFLKAILEIFDSKKSELPFFFSDEYYQYFLEIQGFFSVHNDQFLNYFYQERDHYIQFSNQFFGVDASYYMLQQGQISSFLFESIKGFQKNLIICMDNDLYFLQNVAGFNIKPSKLDKIMLYLYFEVILKIQHRFIVIAASQLEYKQLLNFMKIFSKNYIYFHYNIKNKKILRDLGVLNEIIEQIFSNLTQQLKLIVIKHFEFLKERINQSTKQLGSLDSIPEINYEHVIKQLDCPHKFQDTFKLVIDDQQKLESFNLKVLQKESNFDDQSRMIDFSQKKSIKESEKEQFIFQKMIQNSKIVNFQAMFKDHQTVEFNKMNISIYLKYFFMQTDEIFEIVLKQIDLLSSIENISSQFQIIFEMILEIYTKILKEFYTQSEIYKNNQVTILLNIQVLNDLIICLDQIQYYYERFRVEDIQIQNFMIQQYTKEMSIIAKNIKQNFKTQQSMMLTGIIFQDWNHKASDLMRAKLQFKKSQQSLEVQQNYFVSHFLIHLLLSMEKFFINIQDNVKKQNNIYLKIMLDITNHTCKIICHKYLQLKVDQSNLKQLRHDFQFLLKKINKLIWLFFLQILQLLFQRIKISSINEDFYKNSKFTLKLIFQKFLKLWYNKQRISQILEILKNQQKDTSDLEVIEMSFKLFQEHIQKFQINKYIDFCFHYYHYQIFLSEEDSFKQYSNFDRDIENYFFKQLDIEIKINDHFTDEQLSLNHEQLKKKNKFPELKAQQILNLEHYLESTFKNEKMLQDFRVVMDNSNQTYFDYLDDQCRQNAQNMIINNENI